MKIVVTGACGYIGSYLIRVLPKSFPNAKLILIDNFSTQRYCSLFAYSRTSKIRLIENDVNKIDLENILEKNDIVLHLAANTNATASFGKRKEINENNFNSLKHVASAVFRKKAKLLHLSSTSVYGPREQIVTENCDNNQLNPQSPYAESKLKEETFLIKKYKNAKEMFLIFRCGTVSGTSIGMGFHTAVNKFCWQAANNQTLSVWETAYNQKRPYVSLLSLGASIIKVIKKKQFPNKIVNIVDDNLTVKDILKIIEKYKKGIKIKLTKSQIMNHHSFVVKSIYGEQFHSPQRNTIKDSICSTLRLLLR